MHDDTTTSSTPRWFVPVALAAVLWNLMGVAAYLGHVTMPPEAIAALPDAERELFLSTPVWAKGAFAVAVWAGLLGSITLTARRRLALPVLTLSLLGVLVQHINTFVVSRAVEVHGAPVVAFQAVVLAISVGLIVMARHASRHGWTR